MQSDLTSALGGIFGGKDKSVVSDTIFNDAIDRGVSPDKAYELALKATTGKGIGGLGTLQALGLGLGATALLGGAIGKPKDAAVDRSKIYEPEKTDEFAFDPNMQFTRPEIVSPIVRPDFSPTLAAEGGVMDLRQGGESEGPGTGTSDDIPAMLSEGEFVMTAKAVRGAGGGDRREGAKKMYEAMDRLEAQA